MRMTVRVCLSLISFVLHLVDSNALLTSGDQDEYGASVDNTDGAQEDGRGSTIPNGLDDALVITGRESRCTWAVQSA